jgi:hypothetical protein
MTNQKPILIAGPPRSGTTMLAGLIGKHSVWVGRSRTTMYLGTNPEFGSENIDIKYLMKQEAKKAGYKNWTILLPKWNIDVNKLKDEIELNILPDKQKWLIKTSWTLIFWEFWSAAYPDAYWIFPVRPFAGILDSINRHPSMRRRPTAMKSGFVRSLHKRQKEIHSIVNNSLFVNVNKIVKKDKNEINKLFNFLDIELDWNIVESWIDPDLMKM